MEIFQRNMEEQRWKKEVLYVSFSLGFDYVNSWIKWQNGHSIILQKRSISYVPKLYTSKSSYVWLTTSRFVQAIGETLKESEWLNEQNTHNFMSRASPQFFLSISHVKSNKLGYNNLAYLYLFLSSVFPVSCQDVQ